MFSVSVENRGDSNYYAVTEDYAFTISTGGEGAHPIETVLAGLCSCIAHSSKEHLWNQANFSGEISVRAEADRINNGPRLSEISVSISVKGARLDEGQQSELLSAVLNSSIYNTLSANSEIKVVLA